MPQSEVRTNADPERHVIVAGPDERGQVRLIVDWETNTHWASIWLDAQARRDLIAALAATLPMEV